MTSISAEALTLVVAALIPLYTRISAGGALSHTTRARLHAHLQKFPGLSRRELAEALRVHPMTVLHHLEVLCDLGLIVARREGREFLYETREAPAKTPAALRAKPRTEVVRALLAGPATQAELSQATGLSQRLVAYHLARLGELVVGDDRRPRRYTLADPSRIEASVAAEEPPAMELQASL